MSYRILVTGSRYWQDPEVVHTALLAAYHERPWEGVGSKCIVVHGACPTGADAHAKSFVKKMQTILPGLIEEAHPADWVNHGHAGGPIRNQKMVDLGADVCLAFVHEDSRGTKDCVARAEAMGIEVRIFEPKN